MRALRAILLAAALVMVLPAGAALAQVSVDPSVTPELNTGGWIHGMAILFGAIGLLVILLLVAGYVRFAPRFSTDESTLRVVRADRVRPGRGAPASDRGHQGRRPHGGGAPAVAAAGGRRGGGPRGGSCRSRDRPGSRRARARARDLARRLPRPRRRRRRLRARERRPKRAAAAAETPAPAPAPAAAPAERPEVSLDQEVFDQTLKELLDKGTDKRVAEGQARRAAMIAARKKAAGEA